MASIRERDGKYQVRVIRKGHRAVSRTFTNRGDAAKWARATEVEIERGAIVSGTRCPTLSEAIERYVAECTPRKKSARSERYLLEAWVRSSLGGYRLTQLRPAQIAQWRDTRLYPRGISPNRPERAYSDPIAPTTIEKYVSKTGQKGPTGAYQAAKYRCRDHRSLIFRHIIGMRRRLERRYASEARSKLNTVPSSDRGTGANCPYSRNRSLEGLFTTVSIP